MAIAFDASSQATAGTGNLSWTHTPVGTPRAVMVFIYQAAGTDQVTSVTYGSLTLTEMAGSPNLKSAAEAIGVYGYFAGSAIPTGSQTVTVTVSGAGGKSAVAITCTANQDCSIVDTDATINSDSVTDPSATLSLGGVTCFCAIGLTSGVQVVTGITPFTGWTSRGEDDLGNQCGGCYSYDTIGSADVAAGWTQTAEDAVGLSVAVREDAAAGGGLVLGTRMSLMGVGS